MNSACGPVYADQRPEWPGLRKLPVNIIHSAKVAELASRTAEFGILEGPITIAMTGTRAQAADGRRTHQSAPGSLKKLVAPS